MMVGRASVTTWWSLRRRYVHKYINTVCLCVFNWFCIKRCIVQRHVLCYSQRHASGVIVGKIFSPFLVGIGESFATQISSIQLSLEGGPLRVEGRWGIDEF